MSSYLKHAANPRKTPVSRPIPGRPEMVENTDGGGYVFEVAPLMRLRRWLILGSEGGSYYASESDMTLDNIDGLHAALADDGVAAVDLIREVSVGGLAHKQDPTIYALATACSVDDEATRRRAFEVLPEVLRTGTHLFMFCSFVDGMRSWGQGLMKAVRAWYAANPDIDELGRSESLARVAYQAVKYRQRHGWTHRDVLRSVHPTPPTAEHDALYRWIAQTKQDPEHRSLFAGAVDVPMPAIIEAFEAAQRAETPARTAELVREHRLPREALRTEHLSKPEVNMALLEAGMPTTALVRNLANLTRYGVVEQGSEGERIVLEQLADRERIRKSRLHPIAALLALYTYRAGRGERNTWVPNPRLVDALDDVFYAAFDNVEATGKRRLLAVDVSASMTWPQNAITTMRGGKRVPIPGLHAREAAAALAMVSVRSGDPTDVVAFSSGIEPVPLSAKQRLDDVIAAFSRMYASYTDISLPVEWARSKARSYDAFEVFTDNETNSGTHPSQALAEYRRGLTRDARMIVYGLTATRFTVADPRDPLMLDVVGFDPSVPTVVSEFITGRV